MGISRIYMTRALCFPLSSLLWLRLDRLPVFSLRFKRAILVPLSISHLPSMQQATHPRLHLRDTRDAHIIFEAVRQGFLKPVTRRLNEAERSMSVRSGAVFVWEERDDESGLKRWTDGRLWGQSRMREPYLFYDEKLPSHGGEPSTSPRSPPAFRFVDGVSRTIPSSSALLHQDRSGGNHPGLIKQAYSAWVQLSPTGTPRKWHLTAYFTYADLPTIPTVDADAILRNIIVPPGIYQSGKARKGDDGTTETFGHSALPPLHSAVGVYNMGVISGSSQRGHHRMSEDQRVIQILNSRHIS
ncbi:Gti1/Pac2 family-domain-containing protein [Armillaria nabsnona]|nr:Gti1/Pac2 family-domain-containing protein [Armillaria nabsnona]